MDKIKPCRTLLNAKKYVTCWNRSCHFSNLVLLGCLRSSSSSVSLLMVMILTAGLGVSGMTMVWRGGLCWPWWSRVVLHACSPPHPPPPPPPQICDGTQVEDGPFWTTAHRGGVFSFTRLERWGDVTGWVEDTSYADMFLRKNEAHIRNPVIPWHLCHLMASLYHGRNC